MNKPFAQSCEENKSAILKELTTIFSNSKKLLEIGSGTGQHAVYFSAHLPHLKWQPTDLEENISGINLWQQEAGLENILAPEVLDVSNFSWNLPDKYDAVFTANTLHIMSIQNVEKLFHGLSKVLSSGSLFCCYGPFNYSGQFTSESNARFNIWLKQRDSLSGIRDMTELCSFADAADIELVDDIEMPANNRLLVWKKK